jgi:predicted nucleic-acid-binding protein
MRKSQTFLQSNQQNTGHHAVLIETLTLNSKLFDLDSSDQLITIQGQQIGIQKLVQRSKTTKKQQVTWEHP